MKRILLALFVSMMYFLGSYAYADDKLYVEIVTSADGASYQGRLASGHFVNIGGHGLYRVMMRTVKKNTPTEHNYVTVPLRDCLQGYGGFILSDLTFTKEARIQFVTEGSTVGDIIGKTVCDIAAAHAHEENQRPAPAVKRKA